MKSTYPNIALQSIDGLIFVWSREVLYAIADGNYTRVCLDQNRRVKVLRKLKEVEVLLSEACFIRIHRSHLINLEHVVSFDLNRSAKVLMSDGESLEVARSRKVVFIEKFTRI